VLCQLVFLGDIQFLSDSIRNEMTTFRSKVFGTPISKEDRQIECVKQTKALLGDVLSHHFITTNFPHNSNKAAGEIENDIENAFRSAPLFWLGPEYNTMVNKKLDVIHNRKKFGFPSKWNPYANLTVDPDHYYASAMNARHVIYISHPFLSKLTSPPPLPSTSSTITEK